VEIVNVRIAATTPPPWTDEVVTAAVGPAAAPLAPKASRPILWSEKGGFVDTPVFDRSELPIGYRLSGPAILEQFDATAVLPPGANVTADRSGNLVIETGESEEGVC
jgi:N-methylhydantoinase A